MARDDFDELTPIPRYRGRTVFRLTLLSLLGLAGAGVAGYYAWLYRGELQASAAELDARRLAASSCASDLAQLTQRYDALNKKAAGTELEKQTAHALATAVTADLSATREELDSLRKQRAETEKRLAAFRELTDKFQKMIDSGTIEVKVRNGDMLMAMPAAVLFPSGSAALSRPGELTVMEVGVILKQLPRRRFMVVGHTDNLRVKSATYKDNWELSTARSVTVTQFLISVGLNPKMMMAAGHGEHDPVASNKTKEGREKNRRIEIVLLPDLEEMPPMPKELQEEAPPEAGPDRGGREEKPDQSKPAEAAARGTKQG